MKPNLSNLSSGWGKKEISAPLSSALFKRAKKRHSSALFKRAKKSHSSALFKRAKKSHSSALFKHDKNSSSALFKRTKKKHSSPLFKRGLLGARRFRCNAPDGCVISSPKLDGGDDHGDGMTSVSEFAQRTEDARHRGSLRSR